MKKICKRAAKFILLIIVMLAVMGISPADKKDLVKIYPWSGEVTVEEGQRAYIYWGYGNCTRGLTEDWIRATSMHYTLKYEGEIVQEITASQAEKYWGDPVTWDGPVELCAWPSEHTWKATWEFTNLNIKKPGEYELLIYVELAEPLIDGYDFDQDGQADWYEGVQFDTTVLIHVE